MNDISNMSPAVQAIWAKAVAATAGRAGHHHAQPVTHSLPVVCEFEGEVLEKCTSCGGNTQLSNCRHRRKCRHPTATMEEGKRPGVCTREYVFEDVTDCSDCDFNTTRHPTSLAPRAFLAGISDPIPEPYPLTSPGRDRHIAALKDLAGRDYTPPPMDGLGVVYCAEGRYWPLCVGSIKQLRATGYAGDIEVWHRPNAGEVNPADVDGFGVTLIDADAMARELGDNRIPDRDGGWASKLYALTHTKFERVYFSDADSFLLKPLESLGVNDTLTIWAKGHQTTRWPQVGFPGAPPNAAANLQGGQFLIDRRKCWKELVLAHWMCQHRDYFFAGTSPAGWLLYGDEDTFQVAFALTGQQMHVVDVVEYRRGWGAVCRIGGEVVADHPFDAKWGLPTASLSGPHLHPAMSISEAVEAIQGPPREWPPGWQHWSPVVAAHAQIAARFQPPPCPEFSGRGIVIAAGGKYLPGAYVTIRTLRAHGCTLPVKVFYLGSQGERDERYERLLAPYNVEFVDADAHPARDTRRRLGGWELKLFGVMHCEWAEVLSLDADNWLNGDLTPLFDDPRYRQTGAVFWPDFPTNRTQWGRFGIRQRGPQVEFETGQYLVDKPVVWRELCQAGLYDTHSDFTYTCGHGDTGSLRVGWGFTGREFTMYADRPRWQEIAVIQAGPDGAELFTHRVQDKLRLDSGNKRVGLPGEEMAFGFLDELRQGLEELARPAGPPGAAIASRNVFALTGGNG